MSGRSSAQKLQRENGQGKRALFPSIMNSSQKRRFRSKSDAILSLRSSIKMSRVRPSLVLLYTYSANNNFPAPTPQTPEGFAIRTPTAQDMTPPSHLQDVIPSSPLWTGMDDHPFSQFQNASPSITPRMGTNDFPLLQLQNATFSSPPTMGTDEFSFSVLQNTTTEQDEFSFSPIGDVANLFQHRINTNNLPFFQLEAGLHAQGMSYKLSMLHSLFFSRALSHLRFLT